jgi:hypothetical protein
MPKRKAKRIVKQYKSKSLNLPKSVGTTVKVEKVISKRDKSILAVIRFLSIFNLTAFTFLVFGYLGILDLVLNNWNIIEPYAWVIGFIIAFYSRLISNKHKSY